MYGPQSGARFTSGLPDLSASFDTVKFGILLKWLHDSFGIRGTSLAWLTSCITDRDQTVVGNQSRSQTVTLTCGVPQLCVLVLLLFVLFTMDVGYIIKRYGLKNRCYTDDTQLSFNC